MARKKATKIPSEKDDILNVLRYLKGEPTPQNYNKYIQPLINRKGRKYADKLLGSIIIVLGEKGLSLDDITFDENDNLTVVKSKKDNL